VEKTAQCGVDFITVKESKRKKWAKRVAGRGKLKMDTSNRSENLKGRDILEDGRLMFKLI
jgi:hypothetical protein